MSLTSFLGIFKKEVIGTGDDVYLTRIHLTPWKWWPFPVGFYLHVFRRPDREPHLHDHPRHLRSLVLWGGYDEERGHLAVETDAYGAVEFPTKFRLEKKTISRGMFARVDLPTYVKHRIVRLHRSPTVTMLMITREKTGLWGFWIEDEEGVRFLTADAYFKAEKRSDNQP